MSPVRSSHFLVFSALGDFGSRKRREFESRPSQFLPVGVLFVILPGVLTQLLSGRDLAIPSGVSPKSFPGRVFTIPPGVSAWGPWCTPRWGGRGDRGLRPSHHRADSMPATPSAAAILSSIFFRNQVGAVDGQGLEAIMVVKRLASPALIAGG